MQATGAAGILPRRMSHIAIVMHRHGSMDDARYFLGAIANVWRETGHQVSVLRGPGERVEADLAILHVDLTVVPADHLNYLRTFPKALNTRVADISKRRISANLVRCGDGYDGPVIVKTNLNYGGQIEARHAARRGSWLARRVRAWRARLPWSWQAELKIDDYQLFDMPAVVPRAVWLNPDLVVERFLPERHDEHYCLRTWVFLGDRETNSLSFSKHPVIKSSNVLRREPVPDVPDELRRMRRELGFDFGKFDYAIVDGRVVLYDANRTPTLGSMTPEQYMPRIRLLAEGIRAFL